jgi:tetratricopeptide (TPR) repeat protein
MPGDAFTIGFLFFIGFLALAGAGLTLLRYWLVEGTLDGAIALVLLGFLLFFTTVAIKSASPLLVALWILVVIGSTIGIPFLASRSEKSALFRMHEEDIAKYRRSIEHNPQNYLAWREMAEIYMRMNRYDDAIAAYKEAIKLNPPDVQKIRRRLNAALEYRAGMPSTDTVICDACHHETPKAKLCLHCGAPLELTLLDWVLQRENLREILRPALTIAAGAVATSTLFLAIPLDVKVVVVGASTLVAAYLVWRIVQEI